MNYNYIIINENKTCITDFQKELNSYKQYNCLASLHYSDEKIDAVLRNKPPLIFLIIETVSATTLKIIKNIKMIFYYNPQIIIVSETNTYSKEILNNDILYFLVIPLLEKDELIKALYKFERFIVNKNKKLVVKTNANVYLINYSDILYLEAQENYTKIIKKDLSSILVSNTLKKYEAILPEGFIRIHRKYIINIQYLKVHKSKNNQVLLDVGFKPNSIIMLEVGKTYQKKIPLLINNFV